MWPFSPEAMQIRFNENMQFFKVKMPSLWRRLQEVKLNTVTLSANTKTQTFDVFDRGQSMYLGDCERYVQAEVETFATQFQPGAPIKTLLPITPDQYNGPRFFHAHLNKTISTAVSTSMSKEFFFLEDSIPMLFFSGVGAGIHIEQFLAIRECQIVIIQETNIELLLISLYLTNWYKIIPNFTADKNKFFNFILNSDIDEFLEFNGVWNELIKYSPLFPTLTVFYNHRKKARSGRLIERIQEEFKVYITAWGFYDDEVNQFNNARHNLNELIPILPKRLSVPMSLAAMGGHAVVVGAGPSLNNKIQWIKENRNRITLFSAGTALSILKHHGILPDIHVEIESDYATVLHLEHTLSEDYQPPLIVGAIQLNPKVFRKFKRKIIFFKDSTALFELFGKHCSLQMQGMTPTCTNAGMALAIQLGFKNVYLFGTDFGYKDASNSHAKGSVYFDKEAPEYLQHVGQSRVGKMLIKDIDGETILTEPIYNAARDRIEKMIELHKARITVFNCSDGAQIDGTKVLRTIEEFNSNLGQQEMPEGYAERLFYECSVLSPRELDQGTNQAINYLQNIATDAIRVLDNMKKNKESLVYAILQITQKHEEIHRVKRNSLYFFTRGTLWHYLNAGLSIAFACKDEEDAKKNIQVWKVGFKDFLTKMPEHFSWASQKNDPIDSDNWLNSRITETVEDPFYSEIIS